ncbi:MAG TPA: MFS transporter [Stellaceae bacterium]|jgi:sugar phosphate permease|nr:MFS transporter [Stellaceae bacterium]
MLAEKLAAVLQRRGIHYGWVMVAVTFVVAITTSGAVGVPGALILPLSSEFGWNTAQISSALALRLVLFGLMAPFSAALIERYGVRRVVTLAIGLILLGLCGALLMRQVWHLVLAWGVIVGIGTGMTALVLSAIVASRWFSTRRGLVLGLLTASTSTGQLIFLPLAASLAEKAGWRIALIPSCAALVVAAVLVLLFMRDRPSDVGLAPYGEAPGAAFANIAAIPPGAAVGRAFAVLGEASANPVFWMLAFTFFICGLSTNGLIQTHFIPLCADYGLPATTGATVLAAMGVFDIAGTIGSGWLSDRVDPRKLLFMYYGLRGIALLYLPSSSFDVYGLSVFGVIYGLDWIATVPPTVRIAGATFGRERAGVVFGWIFSAHQVGAAVAAFGAGFTRTSFGTYLPALYIAGAACLIAALLALTVGKAARRTPSPATT